MKALESYEEHLAKLQTRVAAAVEERVAALEERVAALEEHLGLAPKKPVRYVQVLFDNSDKLYTYRDTRGDLWVGDRVVVPTAFPSVGGAWRGGGYGSEATVVRVDTDLPTGFREDSIKAVL